MRCMNVVTENKKSAHIFNRSKCYTIFFFILYFSSNFFHAILYTEKNVVLYNFTFVGSVAYWIRLCVILRERYEYYMTISTTTLFAWWLRAFLFLSFMFWSFRCYYVHCKLISFQWSLNFHMTWIFFIIDFSWLHFFSRLPALFIHYLLFLLCEQKKTQKDT